MLATRQLKRSFVAWSGPGAPPVGPAWLQWVWTFFFCAAIAVGFTILGFALYASGEGAWRNWAGWAEWYGRNLVVACCIGYPTHVAFMLVSRLVGRARVQRFNAWQRAAFYAGVPMAVFVVAWPLGMQLAGFNVQGRLSGGDANSLAAELLLGALIVFVLYQYFGLRWRRNDAERRATEAQLKLLQGQIEPHFLFNTLANVLGLMDADPPRAKLMLESFVDYLRSSLGGLRTAGHTLGQELALVEAYLRIVAIRMEGRLRYRIDVPEALRALPLPALTLQPLVENAVVHGLEPNIDGGEVRVSARLAHGALVLSVEDDGLGLRATRTTPRPAGSGTAIANIRERLAQLHGDAASLQVAAAGTHGVRATLTLPQAS